ncbi:helix-turn-helix transcriptional regulator [Streptomyces sp. NPDC056738]|uniref:helix-turn-helix transcriptional regulator n=1 Tax=Streptomyces sp. NPDC056738 TaxID=3345933 RepID=UPI0036906E3C
MDEHELTQAGHMAEDVFVRQMKRRRVLLQLSQAELATRISELGGSLYQQTIAKIESGQRAVRLQEADLIARALESTVSEMLALSIGDPESSPETMDIEELITQVKALHRRRDSYIERVEEARDIEAHAIAAVQAANQRAAVAAMESRRARVQLDEIQAELNHYSRISLERQSELNAKFGPRWRKELGIHEPITGEWLMEQQRVRLDEMRDLAASSKPMADVDRDKLQKSIEELEERLERYESQRDAGK